jgi:hypothetical protein
MIHATELVFPFFQLITAAWVIGLFEFRSGEVIMNLDNYGQETAGQKITHLAANILTGIAFLIFIAFMLALLACPLWLPTIIEKIAIH